MLNTVTHEKASMFVVELNDYDETVRAFPECCEVASLQAQGLTENEALFVHQRNLHEKFLGAVYQSPEYQWARENTKSMMLWVSPEMENPIFMLEFGNDNEAMRFKLAYVR